MEELKEIIDLYNYIQGILVCLIITAITNILIMFFVFSQFIFG